MKTQQKEYEKEQAKDGLSSVGILAMPVSAPQCERLQTSGLSGPISTRPQPERDRGDGDER